MFLDRVFFSLSFFNSLHAKYDIHVQAVGNKQRFSCFFANLESSLLVFKQVDLFAGALFLREAIGLNIYVSSAALLIFTAVYTLLGKFNTLIIIHQSGVLIFREKSVFFSFQSPKPTNFPRIPKFGRINQVRGAYLKMVDKPRIGVLKLL